MNLLDDIFYSDEYISLYLKLNEELFNFKYVENGKIFINKSIKKPIINIGKIAIHDSFYDLETAYGYGGYYTNTEDKVFIKKAIKKYKERCTKENIIAEFIRFHPFNDFPVKVNNILDFNSYNRDTVVINFSHGYEQIRTNYSSSLKRNINKAKRCDLEYKQLDVNKVNILRFYTLYHETMKRKNALDFYFFDLSYFERLFNIRGVQLHSIVLGDVAINMVVTFCSNNLVYYHLGATDSRYYSLNPNPLLFDSLIKKYGTNFKYLYIGGGATSMQEDPLLRFKRKFSKETKPFYIGGKIHNNEIYSRYLKLWEKQSKEDSKYFLKYRLEL